MDRATPRTDKDTPSHGPAGDPFAAWFAALEARHLGRLTFQEVRRALQALSSLYVERRGRLASGAALESEGKRAAFAQRLARGVVTVRRSPRPANRVT